MEGNEVVLVIWEDNQDWTEIHKDKTYKEMIKQEYKISASEDNRDLLRRLIVAMQKKKTLLANQKCNRNERFQNLQ